MGNETAGADWVRNRKLSDAEKEELEGLVTLDELQKAFDESNFNSSSGWDGMSYRVIGKFWGFLRDPMLKMINETFEEGELMESFKMGIIKVIPKKGNAERLGDWRPIKLLCCGYKIVSGIVANRLERYLMKIMGRAQKGFLKQKLIHTCAANIITCIAQSWEEGEECGIMCVDFKKAFDSVEHDAIKNILRFFNFGEKLVGMVATLLHRRTARIILEEGYSTSFCIARGTPQGDRSSPYIFIICMEILLIKVLSMDGRGIDSCEFIRRKLAGVDIESMTAEAYADDLTIIFKMSEQGVHCIVTVLTEFATVTGLEINKNKTQLMVVGSDNRQIGRSIDDIVIVNEVTLLGVQIDRRLSRLDENWEKVIVKMRRLSGYWSNFGMSITGRVMVAKTYLISQAIYTMSILPLTTQYGNTMDDILVNFVSGRDRPIERRRQFLCASTGGYGLTSMNDMNVYIKSTWIRRIKDMCANMDYIAVTMIGDRQILEGEKDFDYERICMGTLNCGPIIEDIEKWGCFKRKFYEVGNNWTLAKIFRNNAITDNRGTLELDVFGEQRSTVLRDRIEETRLTDIVDEHRTIMDKRLIENRWNTQITWAEYFRLRAGIRQFLQGRAEVVEDGMQLDVFMDRGKPRCSRLRKTVEGRRGLRYKMQNLSLIPSLNSLWGPRVREIDRNLIEWNLQIWTITVLAPKLKDFYFKLMHGRLYLNLALSHFTDTEPGCTFCTIKAKGELKRENINEGTVEYNRRMGLVENETIDHLLWSCRETQRVTTQVLNELAGTVNLVVNRDMFLEGVMHNSKNDSMVSLMVIRTIQYGLYKCRNRRIIPLNPHIREEVDFLRETLEKRIKWRDSIPSIVHSCRRMLN